MNRCLKFQTIARAKTDSAYALPVTIGGNATSSKRILNSIVACFALKSPATSSIAHANRLNGSLVEAKRLALILLLIFAFIGCAALPVQEPLNITIRQVENSLALYSSPISPVHLQVLSKFEGTYIISVVWVVGNKVARYCYLDRGKLVGFCFDMKHFKLTGESTYIRDVIPDEMIQLLTETIYSLRLGQPPAGEEEQLEEPEQKLKEV